MPVVEAEDLSIISQKLDWWGLNYYTPMRVADDATEGAEFPATKPAPAVSDVKTDIGWEVYAPALHSLMETSMSATSCPIATSPKMAPATIWASKTARWMINPVLTITPNILVSLLIW